MDNPFAFLAAASPAALYRLLRKMPVEDIAIALTGLPAKTGVQVMAYFPGHLQADLVPAMRDARSASPEQAAETAARIREVVQAARQARDAAAGKPTEARPTAPVEPEGGKQAGPPPVQPGMLEQTGKPVQSERRQDTARTERAPRVADRPVPWQPRPAGSSPINGPAVPGRPDPVAGDPLQSPLARASLMELIGRAQQTLLPRATSSVRRPGAREGVVRSAARSGPRRAPPARRPAGPPPPAATRSVDGKAILAAILREADPRLRQAVQAEDPSLFRELRGRMFFFDDLLFTEDGALARVFTAAPTDAAALALRFAPPALRERVLRVVSPGRAAALQEPPAARAGLDAIEAAQKKVLGVALQLQAAGRILIDPRDPDLAR
ncbi:MAG: hypothetical protein LIP77_06175 [Planctomycetes bacterium]|nr:hypothetical protein [Planctomycetota bacterium]